MRVVTKKEGIPGYICDLCGRLREPEEIYGFKSDGLYGDVDGCPRHICCLCVHVIVQDIMRDINDGGGDEKNM